MDKKVNSFFLTVFSVFFITSTCFASIEEAVEIIKSLPRPKELEVVFNEFTQDTLVLSGRIRKLEKNFWERSLYGRMSEDKISFKKVQGFAKEYTGQIIAYRERDFLALESFLRRFVKDSKIKAKLFNLLSDKPALWTGYSDSLSDPFADELFVFVFPDGRKIVILIAYVYA